MMPSKTSLKKVAKAILPNAAKEALVRTYSAYKTRRASEAFAACRQGPTFLRAELIDRFMRAGYRPPDPIRYDPEGLEMRAREKVTILQERVPLGECLDCLELGCWDGVVGKLLVKMGKRACGIDLRSEGFDQNAMSAGVRLLQADVRNIPLESGSVDLVYSFAAFEHFPDLELVLAEVSRILRGSAFLYLFFGPVYTSPYGLHAYRQIPVPYCHYLFSQKDLQLYANQHGLSSDWPFVNGVTVAQYRRLWKKFAKDFEVLYYKEHPTGAVGAEMIQSYPGCFRGNVEGVDELFVSAIEIVLQRR
jgi:SAM-dependent methyltransferase